MSTTFPLAGHKDNQFENPVIRELRPVQVGGLAYGEPMTKAEREEIAELREMMHQLAATVTLQGKKEPQSVVQVTPAKNNMIDRAFAVIPTFLMCGTILFTFAHQTATTETDLKSQVTAAQDLAKRAQQNVLMLDTYNRELERAVIQSKAGIKLPTYPVLQK